MDQVNTTSVEVCSSQQASTCPPTTEEASNPTPETPAVNESPQVDPQADADSVEPKPKRLRSGVWQHFNRIEVNGILKAECIYCKKKLSGNSKNGTNHLRNHVGTCIQMKIQTRDHDKGQTFLMPKASQGKQELGAGAYDADNSKKQLACAIILHDYPLSIVDHIGFRRYSNSLQPLFHVPTRNTIKKEVIKIYEFQKTCVMKMLDSHEGRVAITSDMWTSSNQKRGYMAVTGHYIDSTWTLQSRVMRFIYVPAPHTSDRLCEALVNCLMDWNLDSKISTITLDNCSTNDSMIREVKNKLGLENLLRDGSLLHMRCCAHILNLIVKEGLEVVEDGVENIRNSVAYWNATPKRKEKFEETAKQLRVPFNRKLALDCPTRWNSTFKMLDIAIGYKDVFIRLKQRDSHYTCLPSNSQWQFAKDVCKCLELFNSITEMISGTKYPTANLYFPKICEIRLAITDWMNSPIPLIKDMANKMMIKFQSYWSVIHDIMGVATVLDPQFKMLLLEFYFPKLYGENAAVEVNKIQELCYDLLIDYHQLKDSSGMSSSSSIGVANNAHLTEFDKFVKTRKQSSTLSVKAELDHYLRDEVITRTENFDILNWWKVTGVRYPTLQRIARDVLAIPISTVASEAAFSTSGRILNPHRSRLTWTTLEALMCARSWLWSDENAGTMSSSAAQEYATILNEMESDDEDELMASTSGYHFED